MKKIFFLIIPMALVTFLFEGCKNSLDLVPQDEISSKTFWTSENDARLALNGCYGYLLGDYYTFGDYYNVYKDAESDNAFAQYPWESPATAIGAGNINATIDDGYNSRYQFIRKDNYFLANINRVPMDSSLKRRFVAEVRVLRAYAYYQLAWTFGPVPLITKYSVDTADYAIKPTPESDVIQFCLSELSSAAQELPVSYPGGLNYEKGRITKGAALAIKARIELYYGMWSAAVADAQAVMGLGYKLFRVTALAAADTMDNYSRFITFSSEAAKIKFYKGLASYTQQFWAVNNDNSGVILEAQNITNSSYVYGNGLRTLLPPAALGGWSSITPTQSLVNAYWTSNGTTFTPPTPAQRATDYNNGNPDAAYFNEFKNRDTRLYASILFPSAQWNAFQTGYTFQWDKGGNNDSKTGYNFKKLVDPGYTSDDWDGPNNFPIIRYAEVLLIYAEAKNELSGPDPSIYAALDDIRDRSGMPPVDQSVYNTQDNLRQLIRNERRIELAGEGQRYSDIRRWGIADQVMHNVMDIDNDVAQQRGWKSIFVKMPYPQTALDHNPNLGAAQAAKGY